MARHLPYNRAERLADEIYHIMAEAVVTKLSDPRLRGVEITHVRVTPDLRVTRVYFRLLSGSKDQRDAALRGLNSARGYIKRLIGKSLVLKFMPEIEFFYDEYIDESERVEELLNTVKREALKPVKRET